MKRNVRGLLLTVAIIMIAAAAVGWGVSVWRSPHRNELEAYSSFAVGVAGLAVGLISSLGKLTRSPNLDPARVLDDVADQLAEAVNSQWTSAATERRLQPVPIPVRWVRSSLTGRVSAAVGSRQFQPLPELTPITQAKLRRGELGDLHAIYGGLGSGRMLVVGGAGSGKTGAAIRLLLDALAYRAQVEEKNRPRVPVPVIFTLHGWNPDTQQPQGWLAARLQEAYPLFFAGKGGAATALKLLERGRVTAILDGLDEIPDELRPIALQALSRHATFRVVVLARTTEMVAAATKGFLEGAVALELQDVAPASAAAFLASVQPLPRGSRELSSHLRHSPDSPITKALSNPLTLTLVRDIYREVGDVRELLNFCADAGQGLTREDVEDHLLARLLPVKYQLRRGEAHPRYELQTAQHALHYIAARMNQDGTRDLAWWRIPEWVSSTPRVIAAVLAAGLVAGLTAGFAVRLVVGLVVGFGVSLLVGLVYGQSFRSQALLPGTIFGLGSAPQRMAPGRWRQLFSRSRLSQWLFPVLFFGFLFGLLAWLAGGLVVGLVAGSLVGVVFWLLGGVMGEPSQQGREDAIPIGPSASWRRDQAFGLMFGFPLGLGGGVVLGVVAWLIWGLRVGLVVTLVAGLVAWLIWGLWSSATWAASLAFVQLAWQWHTPVHLMKFLEDARKRDVLRTVGPVYQFRHARLQDRLAERTFVASQNHNTPPD